MAIDPFTAASLGVQGIGLISNIASGIGGARGRRNRLRAQAQGRDPVIDALRRSQSSQVARDANATALASGANPAAALRQAGQISVQAAQNNEDQIRPLQAQRQQQAQDELDGLRMDRFRRGFGTVANFASALGGGLAARGAQRQLAAGQQADMAKAADAKRAASATAPLQGTAQSPVDASPDTLGLVDEALGALGGPAGDPAALLQKDIREGMGAGGDVTQMPELAGPVIEPGPGEGGFLEAPGDLDLGMTGFGMEPTLGGVQADLAPPDAQPLELPVPSPEEQAAANLREVGIDIPFEQLAPYATPEQTAILQAPPGSPEDRAMMLTTAKAVATRMLRERTAAGLRLALPASPLSALFDTGSSFGTGRGL
jgi:hypothetical protein